MARNPTPRPALRKAPDATVHPAAPVATVDSRPAVVPPPAGKKNSVPAHLAPVVGLGGSTSDVLRKAPDKKKSSSKQKSSSKKKDKKREAQRAAAHLRRVDLKVKVPKDVRRALRKNAKARGTSVDDVVTNVLQGWLHG